MLTGSVFPVARARYLSLRARKCTLRELRRPRHKNVGIRLARCKEMDNPRVERSAATLSVVPSHGMTPMLAMLEGPEVLIVLAVFALFFGSTQLPKLARSIGEAQREFKKAMHDDPPTIPADPIPADPIPAEVAVIEPATESSTD